MVIELLDERGNRRDDEFNLIGTCPCSPSVPMSLSAVSQIHSPLKAAVTSVKGTMQMRQLVDIISITVVTIVRFALNRTYLFGGRFAAGQDQQVHRD